MEKKRLFFLKNDYFDISHKKVIKVISCLLIGLFFSLTLSNCTQPAAQPLRIGANLWPGYETLYLARELGYYGDKPIHLVDYPSGTEEVRAYRHNEIEGAGLSIDQAIVLATTQKNIKIVGIMDISHGGDAILGKPGMSNMQDLKGKKVGVESTALGAFFLARALEENNMQIQDIEIISLETTEHESAYNTGYVDAVVTFGKPMLNLLAQEAPILFDSSQIPGEIVDTLVINTGRIKTDRETVQALVNGRFKALEYFNQNPGEAAVLMAKRTGVTAEQMLNSFDGLQQPSLQENQELLDQTDPALVQGMEKLIQIMLDNNLISQSIEPANILDDSFVRNVVF
ncbi:ABC-type nitrate/sulfonate/bicarbonate transporter protein [[Leptolyngbya] sp. PCC 7376]|uniref:ABC transporter substrate-binding protein n=1 Tax=[Leptolyngbya] sp. PCC 7376 TaxID=111781 RepID=UPI00029ED9CA|nr:ABC transporter substrate-binding protein [[Leptolyngbya] sp. PCC 7376]AFY37205.1 ABC-type nitrate/sulfonate/bicarbonate transporter protein [[Leptolyngbya] sp. PCC 7376]